MRITTITNEYSTLVLGKQGENLAHQIKFPIVSEWAELYGQGTLVMMHRRNGDNARYMVTTTVTSGEDFCWNISNIDVAKPGAGTATLIYYVGESVIAKSVTYDTQTLRDDGEVGTAPDPWESIEESVTQKATVAQNAATSAGTSATNAQTSASNAATSATNAGTYATNAQNSATSASTSASNASSSASAASGSASQAANNANLAQSYAGEALSYRNQAEGFTVNAQAYANNAQGYANTASTQAGVAEGKAQEAGGYASNAASSASAAQTSATSASASATSAGVSATQAGNLAREAQDAINKVTFVTFDINAQGHVIVNQAERLVTTNFALNNNGHMEVTI